MSTDVDVINHDLGVERQGLIASQPVARVTTNTVEVSCSAL